MPLYDVIVTRDATESTVVRVLARTEAEAERNAREEAEFNPDLEWTLDDGNFHRLYTNGADEVRSRTRADLLMREAWETLDTDSSGNPCVWRNYYRDEEGEEWEAEWSCQCDDDGISPYASEWIGPTDEAEIALWESLPEAWE